MPPPAARPPRAIRAPRAPDLLPVALLAGLVAFVGAQLWSGRAAAGAATVADEAAPAAEPPPDAADPADVRRRLEIDGADTYVAALLDADSLLRRWPDERGTLRVWVQPASAVRGWTSWHVAAARGAFDRWAAVAPLRFAFTDDSAAAPIHVVWTDRLPDGEQVGTNRLTYEASGRILAARLTLAVHDARGRPLPPEMVRVVALHEVGHALGLAHSPDARDVMAGRYGGAADVSAADAATARLLYELPVGRVR